MQDNGDISPVRKFFRNTWVRVILALDAVVVLALIGVAIFNSTKVATVDIMLVPSVARAKIGYGGGYNSGTYKIHPGDYEVEVAAEGFQSKTVAITARAGEISKVYVYLVPEDNGFEWYTLKENYDDFENLAEIASADNNITTDGDSAAEEFVGDFSEQYRLYQEVLPISKSERDVGPNGDIYTTASIFIERNNSEQCKKVICIKTTVINDKKEKAESLLLENGLDLGYAEVIYDVDS